MQKNEVIQLIQETMDSLYRGGLIENEVKVDGNTVLLGAGSSLDSIAFVTFVTDLEDRLSQAAKKEMYLVFNEINEFNADNPYLSVDVLAQYILSLFEK